MDYKDLNDYELIYQVRERDEDAYNTLFKKYTYLVHKLAYNYYSNNKNIGIEYEDLCQEGYFAITRALEDYNPDSTLFFTYVSLCIKREMERLIKYSKRYKHMILNNAVSLSKTLDENEETSLEDVLSSSYDLENYVMSENNFQKLLLYKHNMDFDTSLVYELKINHFTNKEISILLDFSYKKVDNLLSKARSYISKMKLSL